MTPRRPRFAVTFLPLNPLDPSYGPYEGTSLWVSGTAFFVKLWDETTGGGQQIEFELPSTRYALNLEIEPGLPPVGERTPGRTSCRAPLRDHPGVVCWRRIGHRGPHRGARGFYTRPRVEWI
jgi:hypothetical protein